MGDVRGGVVLDPAYRYRATVERTIDGDTYVLRVDLGFRCAVSLEGRLHGVNCPEKNTEEGKKAKVYVESLVSSDKPLVIQSYKDTRSFARWVVDIWLPNGESLAENLLANGHAKVMEI